MSLKITQFQEHMRFVVIIATPKCPSVSSGCGAVINLNLTLVIRYIQSGTRVCVCVEVALTMDSIRVFTRSDRVPYGQSTVFKIIKKITFNVWRRIMSVQSKSIKYKSIFKNHVPLKLNTNNFSILILPL